MPDHKHRRQGSKPKKRGRFVELPAGATLFDGQRPCRWVYQLHSGQVRLEADHNAILDYLSNGDFFGENSLLSPPAGSLTAKTLSPVQLSRFGKSELWDCVHRDQQFAAELIKSLARRLDRHEKTIQNVIVEGAERRLALLLRRFLPGRPPTGWVRLRFSPSNAELARSIGSTRWRIAHFMGNFQRLGWLERRPELWVFRESLGQFLESGSRKT
jgi:CRP-like cAMP-binding protein